MKINIPPRRLFADEELAMVQKVFSDSAQNGKDFGYQGKYEELYTSQFCSFQGGGYADAVSSGTAAVYVALKALNLEKGSDVVVSPVTDPGGVMPVVLAGFNPIICDSEKNSFNVGPKEFEDAITDNTKAAIITHLGGIPAEIDAIREIARDKNIFLIEDCSQAHGAVYKGKKVGTYGDISVFSTMFSKNHASGGCGGMVYTQKEDYYWLIRANADRGKNFSDKNFDPKDPGSSLFPALNFNLDELSCAIGYSTLQKLEVIIKKRYALSQKIDAILRGSKILSPRQMGEKSSPSFFFYTVEVDVSKIGVSAEEWAKALAVKGVWLNPKYKFVVSEWKWMAQYLNGRTTPNAIDYRDRTFNLLIHENMDEDYLFCLREMIKETEKEFIS